MAINDLTYQDQSVFSSAESFKDWVSNQNEEDQTLLNSLFGNDFSPSDVNSYYTHIERYAQINGLNDSRFQRPQNWMDGIVGAYSPGTSYYLDRHGMGPKAEPCKTDPFIGPRQETAPLVSRSENGSTQEVEVGGRQESKTTDDVLANTKDVITGMLTRAADFTTQELLSMHEVNGRQYLGLGLGLMAGFLQDTLTGGAPYALVKAMIQSATGLVGNELKEETNKVVSSLNQLFTEIFGPKYAYTAPFQKLSHDMRQDKYLQGPSSNPYLSIADETLDFLAAELLDNDDFAPDLDLAMSFLPDLAEKTVKLRDQQLAYAKEVSEVKNSLGLASLLAPFEQSKVAREKIYYAIGADPALVDNALAQMEAPYYTVDDIAGIGMVAQPGYMRFDFVKPAGVSDNEWKVALTIAQGKAMQANAQQSRNKLLIVGNVALVAATVFCPPAGAALNWGRLGIMAAGGLMSGGTSAVEYREAAKNLRETTSLQTAGKMTGQDWMPEGVVEVASEGKTYVADKAMLSMALILVPGARTIGGAMIRGGTDGALLTMAGPEGKQDYQNKKAELAGTQAPDAISGLIFSVALGAVVGGATHAVVSGSGAQKVSINKNEPQTGKVVFSTGANGEPKGVIEIEGKTYPVNKVTPTKEGEVNITYTRDGQEVTQGVTVNGPVSVVRPEPDLNSQGANNNDHFSANNNDHFPKTEPLQKTGTDGDAYVSKNKPNLDVIEGGTPNPNAPRASTPNGNGGGNEGGGGGDNTFRQASPSASSRDSGASQSTPLPRQTLVPLDRPYGDAQLIEPNILKGLAKNAKRSAHILGRNQDGTSVQVVYDHTNKIYYIEGSATYQRRGVTKVVDRSAPLADGDCIWFKDDKGNIRYFEFQDPKDKVVVHVKGTNRDQDHVELRGPANRDLAESPATALIPRGADDHSSNVPTSPETPTRRAWSPGQSSSQPDYLPRSPSTANPPRRWAPQSAASTTPERALLPRNGIVGQARKNAINPKNAEFIPANTNGVGHVGEGQVQALQSGKTLYLGNTQTNLGSKVDKINVMVEPTADGHITVHNYGSTPLEVNGGIRTSNHDSRMGFKTFQVAPGASLTIDSVSLIEWTSIKGIIFTKNETYQFNFNSE